MALELIFVPASGGTHDRQSHFERLASCSASRGALRQSVDRERRSPLSLGSPPPDGGAADGPLRARHAAQAPGAGNSGRRRDARGAACRGGDQDPAISFRAGRHWQRCCDQRRELHDSLRRGQSFVIGCATTAPGAASTAIGSNAHVNGNNGVALGTAITATGDASIAIGYSMGVNGLNAIGIGVFANATGVNALAVGGNARALVDGASAFGVNSTANGANAVALGSTASASGGASVAIGLSSNASSSNGAAIAMGVGAKANAGTGGGSP